MDYTDFIGVGSPNEKERTVHAPVLDYQLVPEKTTLGGSRTFKMTFKLDVPLEAPFYMYYQLDNYHQNYRKYVASVNRRQLYGEKLGASQVAKSCFPIISPGMCVGYAKVVKNINCFD